MKKNQKHKNEYLIYNRKSTDDIENQKNSIAYQQALALDYVKREGLELASNMNIKDFCNNGIIVEHHSAYKENEGLLMQEDGSIQYTISRPKFRKLVELLSTDKIKGVVFLCWDRASRNDHDTLILKKLMKQKCDIRFVDANYEDNSSGNLHMSIDGIFANHYSRVISEKVIKANRKLQSEGKCTYSAPLGYLNAGSSSKPFDPVRAPIVQRIFELYSTGEWSQSQLAKWANEQGLTKRPGRRKRTSREIANNLSLEEIRMISRPVTHKTIENILKNPFYIGKIKTATGYLQSKVHDPLVDLKVFTKVQKNLGIRRVSLNYIDFKFQVYRGIIKCDCGRAYSPYEKKGHIYYRVRCERGCDNYNRNISEKQVNDIVKKALSDLCFSDEDLLLLEKASKAELAKITMHRNKKLEDLKTKQKKIIDDIDYMNENRITFLRTSSMSIEDMQAEMAKLEDKLVIVNSELEIYSQSAIETFKHFLKFSELIKHKAEFYEKALDADKHEIMKILFVELNIKNQVLTDYTSNSGFATILRKIRLTGSPVYLFLELLEPLEDKDIFELKMLGKARMMNFMKIAA